MKDILCIIDANLNRVREGLRVCEDIARFALKDKKLSLSLKLIRHNTTKAILDSNKVSLRKLVDKRDVKKDPSKFVDFRKNKDIPKIFMSNIQRAKESLRVLEECSSAVDKGLSPKYRKLRFNAYDVEKKFSNKINTL
ncbi:MAG: thiamine-phosphate pyrophosphorylase [Candidatus Omnitrophota bacterium]